MATERPILFSAPMVRALLAGTKTQTRRVCKNKVYGNGFAFDGGDFLCHIDYLPPSAMLMDVKRGKIEYTTSDVEGWASECPYGQPGDRLWVRETWQWHGGMLAQGQGYAHLVTAYPADGACLTMIADGNEKVPQQPPQREGEVYSLRDAPADFAYTGENTYVDRLTKWWKRKIPAIHMPRWASRILLEVTAVRVERLQEISEADAWAEGCARGVPDDVGGFFPAEEPHPSGIGHRGWDNARDWYADLWEEINGADSWEANPWVWVVEFRRLP